MRIQRYIFFFKGWRKTLELIKESHNHLISVLTHTRKHIWHCISVLVCVLARLSSSCVCVLCLDLWKVKQVSRYVASSAFLCSFLVNSKNSCVSSLSDAAVCVVKCVCSRAHTHTNTHFHKFTQNLPSVSLLILFCVYLCSLSSLLKPLFFHLSAVFPLFICSFLPSSHPSTFPLFLLPSLIR